MHKRVRRDTVEYLCMHRFPVSFKLPPPPAIVYAFLVCLLFLCFLYVSSIFLSQSFFIRRPLHNSSSSIAGFFFIAHIWHLFSLPNYLSSIAHGPFIEAANYETYLNQMLQPRGEGRSSCKPCLTCFTWISSYILRRYACNWRRGRGACVRRHTRTRKHAYTKSGWKGTLSCVCFFCELRALELFRRIPADNCQWPNVVIHYSCVDAMLASCACASFFVLLWDRALQLFRRIRPMTTHVNLLPCC